MNSLASFFYSCLVFSTLPGDVNALPPGLKAGLYGDVVGHSDFQLNLRPPEENVKDVEESLDAVMQQEEGKRQSAENVYASDKQRMLNVEKAKVRAIVHEA